MASSSENNTITDEVSMSRIESAPEFHLANNRNYDNDKSDGKEGIVCTNSDLGNILSRRELEFQKPEVSRRKSITLIQKGQMIRGFLGQDVSRDVRANLFESNRRISTGSFEAKAKTKTSILKKNSKLERSNTAIISWDQERQFVIDPSIIGKAIETHIKNKSDESEILQPRKKKAQRSQSVDMDGINNRNQSDKIQEIDKRKLSLASELNNLPKKKESIVTVNSSRYYHSKMDILNEDLKEIRL